MHAADGERMDASRGIIIQIQGFSTRSLDTENNETTFIEEDTIL